MTCMSTTVAYLWYRHASGELTNNRGWSILFITSLILLLSGYLYSIKVRSQNLAMRGLARDLYDINQIYKVAISSLTGRIEAVNNPEELIDLEIRVLRSVCQRIGRIFDKLLERPCIVTLKLVTEVGDKLIAETYLRSEEFSRRDHSSKYQSSLLTGEDTALDGALKTRTDGRPPHFFSPNLLLEPEKFQTARPDFSYYYRSTLVVPIHAKIDLDQNDITDLIGFVCIDTLSINRLNNSEHLFLLSSFANQFYNFMSMIRLMGGNDGD